MTASLMEFGFHVNKGFVLAGHPCYRPPHWPPPRDWAVSMGPGDSVLSVWGSAEWNFSHWAGMTLVLDFAGGKHRCSKPLSHENQDALRLLTTWLIWGTRGAKSWNTVRLHFGYMRRIAVLCEEQDISMRDLARFPRVIKKIAELFLSTRERNDVLLLLDRLFRGVASVGFTQFGQIGLKDLAQGFLELPCADESEQTAYIPPRIWRYQNERLRVCLEDFLSHSTDVKDCYQFCVDAYIYNYGSLEEAMSVDKAKKGVPPFSSGEHTTGVKYFGPFAETAASFGIAELIGSWIDLREGEVLDIKQFSGYLTLIQIVAIAYILNFTLQRREEAGDLRTDCLIWESDPLVGSVAIIRGETTKTDPDSDARWPTSPSVEIAVKAASVVARLRMRCAKAMPAMHITSSDIKNPFLHHRATDPWNGWSQGIKPYTVRPKVPSYNDLIKKSSKLFNKEELRITEEDIKVARMFTPNLNKAGKFVVGEPWPFAYHQLRRTGAINMFASGLLSNGSVQVIMKHLTLLQSSYYGRNFSKLRFSEDIEGITNAAKYEVMARQIEALMSERYVSPLGSDRKNEIVVNLVSDKDFKSLIKASKLGQVPFRETRLGGCAKRSHCDYGGIESIARCAGGDGEKPCRDAVFDKEKRASVLRTVEHLEDRLRITKPKSPRESALKNEIQGMRNFLDATRD